MFRTYRTFYSFVFRYRWRFVLFILALISVSFFDSIQPYFYKLFIDTLGGQTTYKVNQILIGYVFVRLLGLIFDQGSKLIGDSISISASRDARLKIFKKIQDLDFAYHLSHSTGSLISIFKRGDGAFISLFDSIHFNLFTIFVSFFITLGFFININPALAILMVGSLFINLFFAGFLIKNNIKARRGFNQAEDEVSDTIVDNLINFETVKLFARENFEYQRLVDNFKNWSKKFWNYGNSFRLIDTVVGSFGNTGLFFVLLLGLWQLDHNTITIGQYVMVLGFVSSFYPNFFELIYEFRNIAKHHTDIEKYFRVLEEIAFVSDPTTPITKTKVRGDIIFNNVSFSYPEGKKGAIEEISLHIKPGESVAFVGRSGVGKTTLVKLLMRFYDPTSGSITLDNHDIRQFTKQQLRSFMGVVPQEPVLFNNTIGYNIGYGADNPTSEDIVAAAKMANLHGLIDSLPLKYDTKVGERGIKLSGGQRQRLAIARMIISNPDIIIFDEATSQLDSESEKLIQDAFWKAARGKTTFIIAHRLSTITRAQKIVVLDKGSIAEIGSHQKLLATPDSLYSKFWNLQTQK